MEIAVSWLRVGGTVASGIALSGWLVCAIAVEDKEHELRSKQRK